MKKFNPIVWPVTWAALMLVVCLMPKSDLPEEPFIDIPHFDKWVHAGLFFVFFLTLHRVSPRHWLQHLIVCVAYGAIIEALQQALPTGRSAELMDIVADGFGATFAAIFALIVRKRLLV